MRFDGEKGWKFYEKDIGKSKSITNHDDNELKTDISKNSNNVAHDVKIVAQREEDDYFLSVNSM